MEILDTCEIREIPDGYHREWVRDEGWMIGGSGRKCRMLGCTSLAVAKLGRTHRYRFGKKIVWWPYCEKHLYGRRIANGEVQVDRLVEDAR